ncbi:MAG: penicillin-binding protein 1B [Oceanospirillales bacterium LUC14_002_19_P2]|nr:MAG: penicillin-binding protein 1B [Oceanospirillales bacterium LUC14_002_19_P2]
MAGTKRKSSRQPAKRAGKSGKRKNEPRGRRRWLSLVLKLGIAGLAVLMALMVYLDAVVTRKFEGRKWAIPAKVYAQPLELYAGLRLDPELFQLQLRRQGYQPVKQVSRPGTFSRENNRFHIYIRGFRFPDGRESSRQVIAIFRNGTLAALGDTAGRDVAVTRLDPQLMGSISPASHEDRILVRLDQTPKYLVQTLVTVEDRDFYDHWGLSFKGIARAMFANVKAGGIVQGGSTLTQQLVKNFFLSNERTLVRKAEEALMSLLLEMHYSKDEILETYLNEVYLGQQGQRAIHGFALASQFYFARPLQELDLSRVALLVAIVKGPSWYNPRRYPERVLERRNLVLDMLVEHGVVTPSEANRAKGRPLGVVPVERLQANAFPAYIDLVKRQLRTDYQDKDLASQGLRIFTNMNPVAQHQAQESLARKLKQLDRKGKPPLEGAIVVTDARTGDVQAVVGGRDPGFAGFNRALDARRPIGSLIKPAVYLTALMRPEQYTLATLINDTAVSVKLPNGQLWEPGNFDRKTHGQVPLYQALAKSYNLATAQLGMDVGVEQVVKTLRSMGLSGQVNAYPSLLLGSLDLSPLEVAAMYQTLASGGYRVPLRAINAVLDAQGNPLRHYSLAVEQVFPESSMALIRYAMQETMRNGTGKSAYRTIANSVSLAGKTGTSDEQRDSWFAGFSRDTLAVAWLGYDDNAPTHLTGGTGALRVWTDLMRQRPLKSLPKASGDNIHWVTVDEKTGLIGSQSCSQSRVLPFVKGSEPKGRAACAGEEKDSVVDWFRALFE